MMDSPPKTAGNDNEEENVMKQRTRWIAGIGILTLGMWISGQTQSTNSADPAGGDSYAAEKAKALANPYPNDFGPATIDVSSYPKEMQDTYNNLLPKCARCHTSARPLNSQFIEPSAAKPEHKAKIDGWKKSNPEMFQDKNVWLVEGWTASQPGVWERYVKKMMSKPGCNINAQEGKKIWQFLTYDSEKRKTGANAAKWATERRKHLADFKAQHPARYRELFETH
jgi:hypothetical protein